MDEWFRKNAGIVVFNQNKKVLVCCRNDNQQPSWQFPQGGIEDGETVMQAAHRELREETSITSVKWLKSLDFYARYYFPPEIRARMQSRGFTNSGQDMYWSLFFFYGSESEINLQTAEPEFSQYKWIDFTQACNLIVDFKKTAYQVAFREFLPLIENYK